MNHLGARNTAPGSSTGPHHRNQLPPCPRKATEGRERALCCPTDCQGDGQRPKGKRGFLKLSFLRAPLKELPQAKVLQSYWAWQGDLHQHGNTGLGRWGAPSFRLLLPFSGTPTCFEGKNSFQDKARIPTSHTTAQGCKRCPTDNDPPHGKSHRPHKAVSVTPHPRQLLFALKQVTNSFLYRLVTPHRLQTPKQRGLLYKDNSTHGEKPLWRGQSTNLQGDGKTNSLRKSHSLENPISSSKLSFNFIQKWNESSKLSRYTCVAFLFPKRREKLAPSLWKTAHSQNIPQ